MRGLTTNIHHLNVVRKFSLELKQQQTGLNSYNLPFARITFNFYIFGKCNHRYGFVFLLTGKIPVPAHP